MRESNRHKYEYDVELDGQSAPARVIRMVGSDKKVLELGPGPGSITRHLAQTQHCVVSAIEFDPDAIEKVREFTEYVVQGDLNDPDWPNLLPADAQFDVVVAADVLEHLYSPWETLARMKQFIGPAGAIIVSLPHVGHCALSACIFDADFGYREWGLLDRTHIRFFAVKNIQQLFESAGLKIAAVEFVVIPPENTEFAAQWDKLPEHIQLSLLENPFAKVYQIVVRAVLPEAPDAALDITRQPVEDAHRPMDTSSPAATVTPRRRVRLIAFYLPQYHPIPENDLWWGKGFTEWSNVTKAMPLFDGHYQPHLPADLGFYDLRLHETRHEQIAVAKRYGIDGFCYHYYWFSGKRLLDRPLDDMLADKDSDMPFCLCWANENWTRRWDAAEHEILIAQEYRDEDDLEFIKSLMPFFRDQRYITLNGAPFFIVYRPQQLPDPRRSLAVWRRYCREQGFPSVHIACALTHGNEDYEKYGFDSGVEFPPHNPRQRNINDSIDFHAPFDGHVIPFHAIANSYLNRSYPHPNVFRTVFPSWDNTARVSSRAVVILNGTPANYEYWLAETIKRTELRFPDEDRFVFINAWNEWAEGCHLEPDRRFGHQFLEATYRAAQGRSRKLGFEDHMVPSTISSGAPSRPGRQSLEDALAAKATVEAEFARAREEFAHTKAEANDEIERLQAHIEEFARTTAEANAEIERLQAHIADIHHSTSWRVTSLVRSLGEIRNRVFGRSGT